MVTLLERWRVIREQLPETAVLPPTQPLIEPLTNRELEIVSLIADGCTNKQISGQIHLSLGTVKWYNNSIFGKLGVKNRTQAVKTARALQIID